MKSIVYFYQTNYCKNKNIKWKCSWIRRNIKVIYVLTWESIVRIYNKAWIKELGISSNVEVSIQSWILNNKFESISFDRRLNMIKKNELDNEVENVIKMLSIAKFCCLNY